MKAYKQNNSLNREENKYVFPEDFFAGLEGMEGESIDSFYPLNKMSGFRCRPERPGRRRAKKDEWS